MAKAIDLTGQDFNYLHVIERDYEAQKAHPSERQAWWKCECKACGTIKSMRGSVIRKGKSCGCIQERKSELSDKQKAQIAKLADQNRLDLTNQRFSHLTVLAYAPENKQVYYNGHHQITWLCKCDCGNECYVTTQNLRRGDTTSCGCAVIEARKKQIKDLTGQKFGHLLVLQYMGSASKENRNTRYLVRCDCGKEYITYANGLISGQITSCGCVRSSRGENKVKEILDNNQINYETQKRFFNFRYSDTNGVPHFDFYLPEYNTCIEYDGEQHFKPTYNFDTNESFKLRQQHDEEKNNYCKEHKIILIRIPYTHYNKLTINDLLPEKSNFII